MFAFFFLLCYDRENKVGMGERDCSVLLKNWKFCPTRQNMTSLVLPAAVNAAGRRENSAALFQQDVAIPGRKTADAFLFSRF